ncbi:MAG: hypothetical protein LBE20_00125 [Deltaproteobacteria bacterium]|jgi:hypothetical protein|nr:hypothetical protein [Deltaproteobacteria bacterium]
MNKFEEIFELIDPEALLVKINTQGTISVTELENVVAVLEGIKIETANHELSLDNLYSLILILGKLKVEKYQYLFNKYLELKDPFIVALILETICLEWGKTEDYLEYLINFVVGVHWDSENDVKLTAIKILGEYLHSQVAKTKLHLKIIELLLNIFLDEKKDYFVRQKAYSALCRASGKDWKVLPNDCAILNLTQGATDIDWKMIEKLKQITDYS